MTEGETLFYLREIHLHWSTSNVSTEKLAELEAAGLIESNASPVAAVRLTSKGARQKSGGRRPDPHGRVNLTGKVKTFRRDTRQKKATPAKRLA